MSNREIFRGVDARFYWRLVDGAETVAVGGQGFETRTEAREQFVRARDAFGAWVDPKAPPAKPILGSSYKNPYGDTDVHGYVGLNGRTPQGEALDSAWSAVNISALLPGMDAKAVHLWREVAAGDHDAAFRSMAAGIRQRALVPLLHEPMLVKGTKEDFKAAVEHAYAVLKEARPDLLMGPCYLGNWFDSGWKDKNGADLAAWLPAVMDFVGADTYPKESGRDFDAQTDGFFDTLPELSHAIFETAAPRDHAAGYYSSMEMQAGAHSNLTAIYLWLSTGPLGDYRVEALNDQDRAALDALVASPSFRRSL
jgi:hypothetical protein